MGTVAADRAIEAKGGEARRRVVGDEKRVVPQSGDETRPAELAGTTPAPADASDEDAARVEEADLAAGGIDDGNAAVRERGDAGDAGELVARVAGGDADLEVWRGIEVQPLGRSATPGGDVTMVMPALSRCWTVWATSVARASAMAKSRSAVNRARLPIG